jgi:hypothetical protein
MKIITLLVGIVIGIVIGVYYLSPQDIEKFKSKLKQCDTKENNNYKLSKTSIGVKQKKVTDNSMYIIDVKNNLCFYETLTVHGVSVVEVKCKPGMIGE